MSFHPSHPKASLKRRVQKRRVNCWIDFIRLSLGKEGEVFVGIGVEFFEAHFAAEFHLLILVDDALHLIPFIEGFIGDETDVEGVGFDDLFDRGS